MLLDIPRLRGVPWLEPGDHVTADDLDRRRDRPARPRRPRATSCSSGSATADAAPSWAPWHAARRRAGLHPSALEFLADRRVAVLGSDGNNDTAPSTTEGVDFPVHVLAVHAMGLHLLDYLQFEDLAPVCEAEAALVVPLRHRPAEASGRHGLAGQPDRRPLTPVPTVVVVMGVSGSGKSTVGRLLAQRLGVPFLEADDVHPAANRAKMAAGRPLDDEDRRPWLLSIAEWIREATDAGQGGVVACSALKHAYRNVLRRAGAGVWFLYLALDRATADLRVAGRVDHFMPARLVDSQYATLEPLRPDEPGLTVDAAADPRTIVDRAVRAVRAATT